MTTIEELERRVEALETAQKETAKTQTWMAGTLGRIAAVQDEHTKTLNAHTETLNGHSETLNDHTKTLNNHTKTLNDHTKTLNDHTKRLDRIETDLKGLRNDLPVIIAETLREVLREQRS